MLKSLHGKMTDYSNFGLRACRDFFQTLLFRNAQLSVANIVKGSGSQIFQKAGKHNTCYPKETQVIVDVYVF